MTVLLLLLALFALALAALGWWGSQLVFHPPKMLPNEVWPERYGLAWESFDFRTSDGLRLRGWLIPCTAGPTDRTLLLCHGWGDNKGDLLKRVHFLAGAANLCLFDSRSHGESEGEMTTDGWLEALDFDAALLRLRELRPAWAARLGVYGLSMGAVMAVRGMAAHPEILRGAFEAPFRSFDRVVAQYTWNSFRLPFFPFAWTVLLAIRLRLGANPEPMSPSFHLAALGPRPKLFIAGDCDRLMPLPEVRALHDAAPGPKELYIVRGATHGAAWEFGGEEYRRRLLAFFGSF